MRDWMKHCLLNWRWWLVFPIAMANVPLLIVQQFAKASIHVAEFVDDAIEWSSGYTLRPFVRWWSINKERAK